MHTDVGDRADILFSADHREGFVPECGESCKAANKSDQGERSHFLSEKLSRFSQSNNRTNHKAAQEVDCERPIWESRERQLSLNESNESVSREGSEEPARPDHGSVDQGRFHRCIHRVHGISVVQCTV